MSEFNTCAHLVNAEAVSVANAKYDEMLSKGLDPLGQLFHIQNTLQNALSDKLGRIPKPTELKTKGELYDFLLQQKIAMDDEFREMVEAVGGMSKPESDRSAIWKPWKGKYEELRAERLDEMPKEDRLELMFELVDFAHFFINCFLAMGVTERDLFVMYNIKNAENFARQDRGY